MAADLVILNCARIRRPSVLTIDRIARLQLLLQRRGCELCLADPDDDLRGLIDLAGLSGVLRVQVRRQAEQREEAGGVEEERELSDPPL